MGGFLLCVIWALVCAAILLLIGELLAWGFAQVFGTDVPGRVRQLYYAIVVLLFVISALLCFTGSGALFPLPWAYHGRP